MCETCNNLFASSSYIQISFYPILSEESITMANENPEVVVAPVRENGGADSSSSSKGKEEQLESEFSKKLEITEDANDENEEDVAEEEEGSKGEYFISWYPLGLKKYALAISL